MPLVTFHMIRGVRTPDEIRKLADVTQKTLETHFAAPYRDRYQIITQHEPYEMICEDTGLDYPRTDQLVFIQIFQQGRDKTQKQEFYKQLAQALEKECDLPPKQLIVTCCANNQEDWSFGEGRAQFLDGGLPLKEKK